MQGETSGLDMEVEVMIEESSAFVSFHAGGFNVESKKPYPCKSKGRRRMC